MIAASVYELPTYEAHLIGQGRDIAPAYKCPSCPRAVPATALVSTVGLPGPDHPFVCTTCASGPHRHAVAAQEAQAKAEAEARGEFCWIDCRAHRDILLARCDWTQTPDNALSPEKRAEWVAYRQALRDITNAPSPHAVIWPQAPE